MKTKKVIIIILTLALLASINVFSFATSDLQSFLVTNGKLVSDTKLQALIDDYFSKREQSFNAGINQSSLKKGKTSRIDDTVLADEANRDCSIAGLSKLTGIYTVGAENSISI